MSASELPAWIVSEGRFGALLGGFAAALAATFVLSALAPFLGLLDPGAAGRLAERARKLQERPVARIGGLAVLLGIQIGGARFWIGGAEFGLAGPTAALALSALACAFAVGLADDLLPSGFRPGPKLVLQCAAGLPLGFGLAAANGTSQAWPFVLGACVASAVALNALNTFDNADGAAAGLAAFALVLPCPAAAGALLGFLPFNLDGRPVRDRRSSAAPTAYLGDSGSHLLGMLVLLTPVAWPALVLPLVDLARVACERAGAGHAPWSGDRRHLAHRFAERGLGPKRILLALVSIAAPALVLGARGISTARMELVLFGALATLVLYFLALWFARPRSERALLGRILPLPQEHRR